MTANRTLDIHNVIETELLESKEPEKTVADILSHSFMRSCAVYGKKTRERSGITKIVRSGIVPMNKQSSNG